MATRRRSRGARIAAGVGEGLQDFLGFMLKNRLAEQSNERIMKRQSKLSEQQFQQQLLRDLAEGKIQPEQIASLVSEDPSSALPSLRKLQPPLRRRLEPTDKNIESAKTYEDVPSDIGIFSDAARQGAPNVVGLTDFARRGGVELSELAGEAPLEVQDTLQRAGVKRRALREMPTEAVEVTNPDLSKEKRYVSRYGGPIQTAPSADVVARAEGRAGGIKEQAGFETYPAEQRGANKAVEENALLKGVGSARAAQAARVKTAEEEASMAPNLVNARVSEAGRKASATRTAEINAQLAKSKELLAFETAKAVEAMKLLPMEAQSRAYGQQIQEANEGANQALPMIAQLRALWDKAQPRMQSMGMNSEMIGQIAQGLTPRGALPVEVRQYLDLRDQMRPFFARMMKQVGNPAIQEQEWAVKGGPDFIDAVNGGVAGDEKLDRLEAMFSTAPKIVAELSRPDVAATMSPQDRAARVTQIFDEAMTALKGKRPQSQEQQPQPDLSGVSIVIGPGGKMTVRPPGQ